MKKNSVLSFFTKLNRCYLGKPWWFRLLLSSCIFIAVIVGIQDIVIFPGIIIQMEDLHTPLPAFVESITTQTSDGKQLEVWHLPSSGPQGRKLKAAIVFHGNAGDVRNFFPYQKWLSDLGYLTYSFDYRGFGKSTGWPSERGIERDADAVVTYVQNREKIVPAEILLFGISIGTAPAVYVASHSEPGAIVLLAPFPSLPAIVRTNLFYRLLAPLLWYKFPTEDRVQQLQSTCFIVVHGRQDEVIPFELGASVAQAYRGKGYSIFIDSPQSHHNDILNFERGRLASAIGECEARLG